MRVIQLGLSGVIDTVSKRFPLLEAVVATAAATQLKLLKKRLASCCQVRSASAQP